MYTNGMKYLKQITYALVLLGALNWGIYGISGFDLIDSVVGIIPGLVRIVYVLVGLSAVYVILNKYILCDRTDCFCHKKNDCKNCDCGDCDNCKKPSETNTCSV
jgi:uncharacterized membrane protein YuzA (DUF378 family)